MTDGGKQFPNQEGFPTPTEIPLEYGCRTFSMPSSAEFFSLLEGALQPLTKEYNWYVPEGGIDKADAAQLFIDILSASYEESTCAVVPAPYWDDDSADDADDQAPADDQPWYGELVDEGLTWREQVGIWAITGFLAVAATPAAAIAFLPFANRFVLAFKQHSLGAIVKVLVDGLEIAQIDTYGVTDAVRNVAISLPTPAGFMAFDVDPPVLWVVMSDEVNPAVDGDPSMQVIRKRLDQTDVTPANLRWNEDCDCVQQSPDNGVTWVDSPGQDPRTSIIFQVPARTGEDAKCDAAQQMHDRIKNMLDAIITSSDILQAINAVVGVVAVFFFEFGIVIEAIWAIVSAIFSVGTTTLNAALTDAVYDALLCVFYCHISEDGTVTQDQYDAIVAQINDDFETVAAFAITQALQTIGFVGLTNAGALGEVTGDCDDCECGWCVYFDFRIDDYSEVWSPVAPYGQYAPGNGWQQVFLQGLIMQGDLGGTYHVTSIEWAGACFVGGGPYSRQTFWNIGGSTLYHDNQAGIGNPYTCLSENDLDIDQIVLQPTAGSTADTYIQDCWIRGTGTPPSIGVPC